MSEPAPTSRDPRRWQLPVVVAVSTFWESLFLLKGSNLLDEGWALYTGMQLGMGRRLYDDISWVFPPGHALPAWIGHVVDPQGVIVPRLIYAAFAIALCAAIYELGRKLSPPTYAFLGALLLAVAAPRSHMMHLLYGYRYLVLAVVVLLFYAKRLERDDSRWMLWAGALTGICLIFRVTPAFAVACGIGVAVVTSSRSWQVWFRDWTFYAVSLLVVMAPALAWFAMGVGLERVWQEVIARPMSMLQALPVPDIAWPVDSSREAIAEAWRAVALRLFVVMYAAYGIALTWAYGRALILRRPFEHALLVAVVVFGAVFFLRAFGRADEPHMDTTLPPICLLMGHSVGVLVERWKAWRADSRPLGRRTPAIVCATVFVAWVLLIGSDTYPWPSRFKRIGIPGKVRAGMLVIERYTESGEIILDLSAAPMYHALTNRPGPGGADIIMEGTFVDEAEELAFIERLEAAPPAAVLWPVKHFDDMPSRGLLAVAPRVARWAANRYVPVERDEKFVIGVPRKDRAADRTPGEGE